MGRPEIVNTKDAVTIEDLESCLDIVADLVADFGKAYLPFYQRLEKALEDMHREQGALLRVLERTKRTPR